MKNSTEVPQKTKNTPAVWASKLIPGYISAENYNSKRYTQPYVHGSTIYDSQDKDVT